MKYISGSYLGGQGPEARGVHSPKDGLRLLVCMYGVLPILLTLHTLHVQYLIVSSQTKVQENRIRGGLAGSRGTLYAVNCINRGSAR